MRISDWSSDVCSSDLGHARLGQRRGLRRPHPRGPVARARAQPVGSLGQHPQGCGAERGPDRRTAGRRGLKRCGSEGTAARVGAMNRGKGVTRTLHKAWLLLLALVLAALAMPAFALGLGQSTVKSERGEPLLAEIA